MSPYHYHHHWQNSSLWATHLSIKFSQTASACHLFGFRNNNLFRKVAKPESSSQHGEPGGCIYRVGQIYPQALSSLSVALVERLVEALYATRTSQTVQGSNPDQVIVCFQLTYFFQPHMAPWSIQLLTEMSTRDLPGSKGRPARKDDNITAIYEPTI
jgi:hypothetical protein